MTLDVSRTLLYLQAKIVKANGDAIGPNDKVASTSLLLHRLFSQVDVKLNDQLVCKRVSV